MLRCAAHRPTAQATSALKSGKHLGEHAAAQREGATLRRAADELLNAKRYTCAVLGRAVHPDCPASRVKDQIGVGERPVSVEKPGQRGDKTRGACAHEESIEPLCEPTTSRTGAQDGFGFGDRRKVIDGSAAERINQPVFVGDEERGAILLFRSTAFRLRD